MATREQLIEDFADHKYATGEKFERLINSMKVVQLPVVDPQALGTSLSFIDSISQDADGKITATKKTLDLANAHELNPFKGWYKTGDTLPTTGFDGAYLYFKDTAQTPAVTTIYQWNGTAYADTGTVVDESNVQTFATGQAVNSVGIADGPITGSENLVRSGGVASQVFPLKTTKTIISLNEFERVADKFVNSSTHRLEVGTSGLWESYIVSGFNKTYIKAFVGSDNTAANAISFYSDSTFRAQAYLGGIKIEAVASKEYIAAVPENCKYIVVCNKVTINQNPSAVLSKVESQSFNELYTDISLSFKQGSIGVQGDDTDSDTRVKTDFIPIKEIKYFHLDEQFQYLGFIFSEQKVLVDYINGNDWSNSDIANLDINGFIRFAIKYVDSSPISPSDNIIYRLTAIQDKTNAFNNVIRLTHVGPYLPKLNEGEYGYILGKDYVSLVVKLVNGTLNAIAKIGIKDDVVYIHGNEIYTKQGNELLKIKGVPEGGQAEDVLTPDGWSGNYATITAVITLLQQYVSSQELTEQLALYVTKVAFDAALSEYEKSAHITQLLQGYMQTTDYVNNIEAGAVTVSTLSQAVLDLINAGGGGTIVNNPDDIDIETNSNNQLQLKGGGVVRFRLKSSAADNYTELVRCMATGLPIQIENSIDLANSDGSIRDISFNGETLVFVGNGQIKNCHITGNVYIQANKTKIFDNVYFHHWTVDGSSQVNADSLYGTLPNSTTKDVYNRRTKELFESDTSEPINMFDCSFTRSKIGEFATPVLENGKYVYKEGSSVVLTFDDDGNGNIKLPIRKDYLFLDDGSVAESTYDISNKTASYTYVAASDLTISRLFAPTRVVDGRINGTSYPEWWGAKSSSSYDSKEAMQWAMIHGGDLSLSSNLYVSGDIRVFSGVKVNGNGCTIHLLANSTARAMFEIETISRYQDGIIIYDLKLEGNREGQINEVDGIFADFQRGQQPFSGYGVDNTYWYNLTIKRFSGSGVCVAVPGTSHIYSSFFAYNNRDGICWDNEHFTLTNVTCWDNGRHGAYAGGNHWRIIGGAYAHNDGGDNIHCDGAFESQIIGCSCIDAGKFIAQTGGGYVASSQNVYGYIWAGEGQGTHALVGGNGINLIGCRSMTMIGVRLNNHNANGILINGGQDITISECLFVANNMTKGTFKDIDSNISSLYICNTKYNGSFVVTNRLASPKYFGNSGGNQNWNNLKATLPIEGEGIYEVADYYNAANRPSGAGTYLEGTVVCKYGISDTVYRTYIRLMDETGNVFVRYMNIKISDGTYSSDTGWKKITPTSV